MGNLFSNNYIPKISNAESINLYLSEDLERTLHKLDASATKCPTEHACQIEAQDIEGLDKLKALEEYLNKKLPLSSAMFDELWDSIHENGASFFETANAQKFSAERDQIIVPFQGTDFEKKQEASKKFKEAIDKELKKIAKKNSKEDTEEVDKIS